MTLGIVASIKAAIWQCPDQVTKIQLPQDLRLYIAVSTPVSLLPNHGRLFTCLFMAVW